MTHRQKQQSSKDAEDDAKENTLTLCVYDMKEHTTEHEEPVRSEQSIYIQDSGCYHLLENLFGVLCVNAKHFPFFRHSNNV